MNTISLFLPIHFWILSVFLVVPVLAQRTILPLNDNWKSKVTAENTKVGDQITDPQGIETPGFSDAAWKTVSLPHNWEDYHTKVAVEDNSFFGVAWYRTTFVMDAAHQGKRIFYEFDGAGDYTKVWVNGTPVGDHKGALTGFSCNITDAVVFGGDNTVAVRVDHPNNIADLPWVPGDTYGEPKHEGSQPFGLHRPTRIVVTNPVRIERFGTHVMCPKVSRESATVRVRTEVKNYSASPREVTLKTEILTAEKSVLQVLEESMTIGAGVVDTFDQSSTPLTNPRLWDGIADPYLHSIRSTVHINGAAVDELSTSFGIRSIQWPRSPGSSVTHFKLNGRQVFLNGTCEYQHLLGNDHAFTEEQIKSRMEMIRAAGFNAVRDAHYPHTLSYYDYMDQYGIVNWPQMSSRTNSRSDEFVENYKMLTREWIKERRNHPCIVLWGVQNESDLTRSIHSELVGVIREMDPLSQTQRLAVVCHSTVPGTDWELPQDWSGVYGGNFNLYDPVLDNEVGTMVGEYGSWVVLGHHVDKRYNGSEGDKTETYARQLYETKIRRGEELRDRFCGHFQWIFSTHSNPGRPIAPDERQKEGWGGQVLAPVNNKGLLTLWGQPYDAFYVYRSNYAPKETDPMVYIVSHTWPDRWDGPGAKNNIVVYSNCEEVTLYNDYKSSPLGSKTRGGIGTHFTWDNVTIQYNVLYAEGNVGGRTVASDIILLDNLPAAPNMANFDPSPPNSTAPESGKNYLYRLNCGGEVYSDKNGNTWSADKKFSSGNDYGNVTWGDVFHYDKAGGNSITYDPIRGTDDDKLMQTFRYGRHYLNYRFAVPHNGTYGVELYFNEPWYGTGDGPAARGCKGWRLFDVALEGETVINNLDIWERVGHDHALKIVKNATVSDGILDVTFPEVKANQACISAIAVMEGPSSIRGHANRPYHSPPPRIVTAAGNLSITIPASGNKTHSVEILEPTGRLIHIYKGHGSAHYTLANTIQTRHSGVCIIRIKVGNQVFTTKRITFR